MVLLINSSLSYHSSQTRGVNISSHFELNKPFSYLQAIWYTPSPMWLAASDTVIVYYIYRYRLAPKYTFPAQFHDCYAVVKTLLATGDKYGIDTSRLVVSGDSAGGNLAAAIALKFRDEGKQLAAQVRTP